MKLIKGDILSSIDSNIPTIVLHGCNCFHVMGGGIAYYLAGKFPQILKVDQTTPIGDVNKLGSISHCEVERNLTIVNCYTQFSIGVGREVNYEAVYSALENVRVMLLRKDFASAEVRAPQIGCGLAGGDWSIIEPMFDKLLPYATIYHL